MLERIKDGAARFGKSVKEFFADPVVEQLSPEDPNAKILIDLRHADDFYNWRDRKSNELPLSSPMGVARIKHGEDYLYLFGPEASVRNLKYGGFKENESFLVPDYTSYTAVESNDPNNWFRQIAEYSGRRLTRGITCHTQNGFNSGSFGDNLNINTEGHFLGYPDWNKLIMQVLLVDCHVHHRVDSGIGVLRVFAQPITDKPMMID
jgi:hypothetical protein